ncbi:integrase [Burkholderia gladioli]|nr:integrase [Burkholderia gladioli]
MFNLVNQHERLALARLLELCSERKHWYRSLWGIGTILSMDELVEACSVLQQGHLSEGAVKLIASSLQKRVSLHPGFTDAEQRFLRAQIHQVPRAGGVAHYAIRELSERVSADYLERWATAVGGRKFRPEHFARHICSHILDAGFSAAYLHKLISDKQISADRITLPELCEELQGVMRSNVMREFEVLLAFKTTPWTSSSAPTVWLSGAAVTEWLSRNSFDTSGVRAAAAMIIRVRARDEIGAAEVARNDAGRYSARALLATGRPLDLLDHLWVAGSASPAPMRASARGVEVRELHREQRVFATNVSQDVDAALELLAHLEGSSPPAAVAGGWGAIEGLLADPSDRSSAADNLASLVACSFPRAELTSLSHRCQRMMPTEFAELSGVEVNRERSRILATMILENRIPDLPSVTDQAAVERMRKLLSNPRVELQTIRDMVSESFHRLYRQRNMILHGGRLNSVALTASLRTVAKLAGAGMDRITHGHYVQGLRPLELVAKANLALSVVDGDSPLKCVDLLEAS